MKINIANKENRPTLISVPMGDIFATEKDNELYVRTKTVIHDCSGASVESIGISNGASRWFPANTVVRKVKAITIEFEE